ncbi:hypothetical protein COO60DRAFT_1539432, partial [Scenedesmus sp. NREL 46B-D3]
MDVCVGLAGSHPFCVQHKNSFTVACILWQLLFLDVRRMCAADGRSETAAAILALAYQWQLLFAHAVCMCLMLLVNERICSAPRTNQRRCAVLIELVALTCVCSAVVLFGNVGAAALAVGLWEALCACACRLHDCL